MRAPGGRAPTTPADEQLDRLVRALLDQGVTAKTLAKALAELPGVSHKEAYARVLAIADAPMTLTRVSSARAVPRRWPPTELAALRAAYEKCAVDVGTGDAHFAYHLASERPDWLVDRARRARRADGRDRVPRRAQARARRPARISCCCAPRSRRCPPSSQAIADEVDVLLPWGALLEGIVRARAEVVGGIAALAPPGARRQ